MRMNGGALGSIYKHLLVYTMSFLPQTTLKFHAKDQILGILSAQEMGQYAVRRDIH